MQRGQISKVAGTAEGPRVRAGGRGQLRKGCPEPVGEPRPLGWSLAGKQDSYLQTTVSRGRHHSLGKSRQLLHLRGQDSAALKRTSQQHLGNGTPKLRETAGWRAGQTARKLARQLRVRGA